MALFILATAILNKVNTKPIFISDRLFINNWNTMRKSLLAVAASWILFSNSLLAQQIVCPEGSKLSGSPPPSGTEFFCKKEDGSLHGPYQKWYDNGQLMLLQKYKKGKEHGEQKSWWPNGQLMMQGTSINGRRYQGFKYWDITGKSKTINTEAVEHSITSQSIKPENKE